MTSINEAPPLQDIPLLQPQNSLEVADEEIRLSDEQSCDDSCYESDDEEIAGRKPAQAGAFKKQVVQAQKKSDEQRLSTQPITPAEPIAQSEQIVVEAEVVTPMKPVEFAPMPLIKSGASVHYDMMEGWRPQQELISGAPIPLYYDYEEFSIPINPLTNKPYVPLYYGPRRDNSLDVHKAFAAKPNGQSSFLPKLYDCGPERGQEEFPLVSYNFKFPRKVPYKKHEADREFTGMNRQLNLTDELIFDSDFESGNLDMVIKTGAQDYGLYMRVDTNTRGHHQWFYFTVTYPPEWHKRTVSFTVCNFTKDSSLYNQGMRIAIARQSQDFQWFKGGEAIEYKKSKMVRRNHPDPLKVQYYYSLSFKFTFEGKAKTDTVCFAYCYPYTFSKLQRFLKEVNLQQKATDMYSETSLCKSLSGIDVPICTITSRLHSDPKGFGLVKISEFEETDSRLSLPLYKRKKYVIIGARVHPGESNGSYMMQGLIKYLLGESHQARELRKRIVFKIIPMTNPDGVVIGNYRTSMSGHDLNRRYHEPDYRLHPTVVAIKQLTSDLVYGKHSEPEEIVAFIDMHGHSRKKNTFVYGPEVPLHSDKYYKMRIIPKLIGDETSKFRYFSCKFRHEHSKLKAARIVMYRQFNIFNCYTYEASLHGYFDENNQNYEFNCQTYEEMGEHLVNGLYEYIIIQEEEERRRRLKEIEKRKKRKLKKQLEQKQNSRQEVKDLAELERKDTLKRKQTATLPSNRDKNPSVIIQEIDKKGKKGRKKNDLAKQAQQMASQATDTEPGTLLETLNNPNEPPSSRHSSAQPRLEQPKTGYRRMNEVLESIRAQEERISKSDSDKEAESSDGGWDSGGDNDELPKDQEKKLISDIFDAISQFTKLNNISDTDYFAMAGKKRKKKVKPMQSEMSAEKKEPQLTEGKSKKLINVPKKQKVTVAPMVSQKNYQTNTLSVQQKRRSFISDFRQVPSQQEYQNFIVYGAPSPEGQEPQYQQTEIYNFQEKRALQPVSNYVFGVAPDEQNYSPIRQHPQFVFDNAAVKQFNTQKQQQRVQQTTLYKTKGFEGTYFQQQFLQPMNFNFFSNPKQPEESKQAPGFKGIKIGRNKIAQSNTITLPQQNSKSRPRYQGQPILRKMSREKLETILTATDEDQTQDRTMRNASESKQSLKKSVTNVYQRTPQFNTTEKQPKQFSPRKVAEGLYGDSNYKNNFVAKESIQRTSLNQINNHDGKFPQVAVSSEYYKTHGNLKGFSETNVGSSAPPSMTFQPRRDGHLKQMQQIQTNPALHDIFVDQLFKASSGKMGSEDRRPSLEIPSQHFNSPNHLLHNFNAKRSSKTTQKQKDHAQDDPFIMRPRLHEGNQSLESSDYAQILRVDSAQQQEYGLAERPKARKDTVTKHWQQLPSVDSISIRQSKNGKPTPTSEERADSQKLRFCREMEQIESQFFSKADHQGAQGLYQNSQIQMLPVSVINRESDQSKRMHNKDSVQGQYESKLTDQSLQHVEVVFRDAPLQNHQNSILQPTAIQNIFNKDFPVATVVSKGQTVVRTQKTKYQPYSFKKTTFGSPCISPRSQSPQLATEAKRERALASTTSIHPQEAQRKLNEITMKQYLHLGAKGTNYGPLTRQLATGGVADRAKQEPKLDELYKQVHLYQLANVLLKQQQLANSIEQQDNRVRDQSLQVRRTSNNRQRPGNFKEFPLTTKTKPDLKDNSSGVKSKRASRGVLTPTQPSQLKNPIEQKLFGSVGIEAQLRKTKSHNKN